MVLLHFGQMVLLILYFTMGESIGAGGLSLTLFWQLRKYHVMWKGTIGGYSYVYNAKSAKDRKLCIVSDRGLCVRWGIFI